MASLPERFRSEMPVNGSGALAHFGVGKPVAPEDSEGGLTRALGDS